MRTTILLLRAAGLVLTLLWATPAAAQVQPCPAPAKQPPAGSPVLLRCMQLIAHPVNETLVDGQTYAFYIRTPQPDSANDRWVPYNPESILTDFNNLWKTNFLENLWVEVLDEPYDNGVAGKHVIFHIEERNRVKAVDYAPVGTGAKLRVDVSKIDTTLKERSLEISLDTFVDEATIRKVVGVIRELYAEQGYNDAIVEPTMREVAGGSKLVDLRFNIREGPKVRLRDVVFDGNVAVTDQELRGQLKENKPRSRILILVGGGQYREDKFDEDAEKLGEYYRDRGYAGAQIGSPQVETLEVTADGKTRWIRMRVPVEEGPQFRVGEFTVSNAVALKAEGLRPFFDLHEGEIYSLKKLRKGFEKLKELYGAFGYYQWTPDPELKPRGIDEQTGKLMPGQPPIMDINVKMNEGKQFFVNRITFVGNHTTRDPVIRRELRIAEGAVFNSEALKESVRRLNQLGYFKPLKGAEGDMDVTPTPGQDDKIDVKMKVEEQNRNSIAFGAGVSQWEGVFGQLSFSTSNFLGRGETLGVSLQKGARARQYQVSFSEPYLWDRPITAGFDLHSRQYIFIGQFTQRSSGGNAVIGLPLADYTRLFMGYSYEQIWVLDVNPAYLSPRVLQSNPYLADSLLIGQGGRRTVSKVSPSMVFNTVNQPIFPTSGRRYSLAVDVAGLGGNTSYNQVTAEGIWYFKLPKTMSLGLRAQTQYIRPYGTTTTLPIFEKIFLGGEYNIRGYDLRSVSPRDSVSGVVVGGNKSIVLNAEYYIDIGQVRVLAFYDAGQVQDVGEPFRRWDEVRTLIYPPTPILVNLSDQPYLLTEIGAIRSQVIGRVSATRTSTGVEARFIVPFINIPFRLIGAYNPQRFGVINNNGLPTPKFTFRFAVGTTF